MEPELGVGIITEVSPRTIRLLFPAAESERQYAIASAPIQRLEFKIGDAIRTSDGQKFTVTEIENINNVLTYICGDQRIPEHELDSVFSFTSPKDRLLGGFYNNNSALNLRIKALQWRAKHLQSPAFGFIGGRIDLIPHQLYVASQTASRQTPRVLLSDEVGLGKTIEACLILHRLLLSGRIGRVLVIVPESLVHQWFVELLRRFNLVFRIIDADYIASQPEDAGNPFEDDQLALISLAFLMSDQMPPAHALDAGWDMIVIDEAHHILEDSPEYERVEHLAAQTKGLLLLTATPEQLGHRSHFARLKLLDPSRYHDFDEFEKEAEHYQHTAHLVNALLDEKALSRHELSIVRQIDSTISTSKSLTTEKRQHIMQHLLDRYGMGRVILRNTRAAIPNFPKRRAHLYALESENNHLEQLQQEFDADCDESISHNYDYKEDPRLLWLVNVLQKEKSKILLICRTLEKVFAIEQALQKHISVKTALFHEEMTLIQRDRNAAWFSQQDGAQLLICSEIGSEGRNFQFSHHLVLFDVPLDPELLEQRIGRLDRIGQKQTINIHIPFVPGSPQDALIQWYHDGFNAFEDNAADAFLLYEKYHHAVRELARQCDFEKLIELINDTQRYHVDMSRILQAGRNRLLELNSFDTAKAKALQKEIQHFEHDPAFENLMLRLFQHFDVHHDAHDDLHIIGQDPLTDADFPFPPFRSERVPVTFDRATALSREELEYVTPDHPMAMGAIDLLLASEKGNAVLAHWPSDSQDMLLEAFYIHECVAPAQLHIERFFPPSPLRVVVNHAGEPVTKKYSFSFLNKNCKTAKNATVFDNPSIKLELFPDMLDACFEHVQHQADDKQRHYLNAAMNEMNHEIERLESLRQINPNISTSEIESLKQEKRALHDAITNARLRLDSIRFIIRG